MVLLLLLLRLLGLLLKALALLGEHHLGGGEMRFWRERAIGFESSQGGEKCAFGGREPLDSNLLKSSQHVRLTRWHTAPISLVCVTVEIT